MIPVMAAVGNIRLASRFLRMQFVARNSARLSSCARVLPVPIIRIPSHLGQSTGSRFLDSAKTFGIATIRLASSRPKLSEEDVRARVMVVCKGFDKINADKLNLETHFMNDLGLDSLDHVELIMAIEDEFGFEITDLDAEKLVRPADIVKYVTVRYNEIE